jgi:hypothetical protein
VIGLSDNQLRIVMTAASPLPPEKRALLERTTSHLLLRGHRRGRRFGDVDVERGGRGIAGVGSRARGVTPV